MIFEKNNRGGYRHGHNPLTWINRKRRVQISDNIVTTKENPRMVKYIKLNSVLCTLYSPHPDFLPFYEDFRL